MADERDATARELVAPAADPLDRAPGALVVVPSSPGPLRSLAPTERPADDLDHLIDDLFGPTPEERPGVFDVGLIVAGIGLLAWGVISTSGGALVLGLMAIVLGLALPGRAALRRVRDRRRRRTQRHIIGDGTLLDVSNPVTAALAAAYSQLVDAARDPEMGGDSAITAAHLALVEVATLLEGRPPDEGERAYVDRRTEAIDETREALVAAAAASRERRSIEPSPDETAARIWAAARLRAREELESVHRVGSVDLLASVREGLREERGHDR